MSRVATGPQRISVLVSSWDGDAEVAWARSLVLRALASVATIELIHLGDPNRAAIGDHTFPTHRLGDGAQARAALQRDLLVARFSAPSDGREFGRSQAWPREALDATLGDGDVASWRGASRLIEGFGPDVVVVLDHRDRGVLAALPPELSAPVLLIPLVDMVATPGRVHFDQLFERADHVVAFSALERRTLEDRSNAAISVLDLPVELDRQGARSDGGVHHPGDPDILIFSDTYSHDRFGQEALVDLVVHANPARSIIVAGTDSTAYWRNGTRRSPTGPGTGRDIYDLMSGASVTVDLHPGRLVARRCISSLRLGTPIVVPKNSRAAALCSEGMGGLWFSNTGELLWAIDAILAPDVGPVLGAQGRQYCDQRHGSFERFAQQLSGVCHSVHLGSAPAARSASRA